VRSVAIIGLGLIGTSVKLAAGRRWPGVEIREIHRTDSLDAVRGTECVILATPVDHIIATLPQLAPLVDQNAVVIDTGSTKRAIVEAARRIGFPQFVGGHPVAGGTAAGPGEARADLFDGRPWILINDNADRQTLGRAREFVAGLGANAIVVDDDGSEHDRILAAISHLPQVVASALMVVAAEAAGPKGLKWAGAGLRDTTRLAQSHAEMWLSILATNRDALRPLLKQLGAQLDSLADRLDDPEAVKKLFDDARRAKSSCL
jgi:prephenate dehydrogenase